MLDTVKIRSPKLPELVALKVERLCERRVCMRVADEAIMWEFTKGQLVGSYDHRLAVHVRREEWVQPQRDHAAALGRDGADRSVAPILVPCEPYLEVEGSIHKALLGHNVHGGPEDVWAGVRWLVDHLGLAAEVDLPDGSLWQVRRLDWAEVYDLGSAEAVAEFVGYLRNAEFSTRRTVGRHGRESIHIPGSTTTVKLYHKGPEFAEHDRKRLRRVWPEDRLDSLQAVANNLLRCEVEIHARALDELLPGHSPAQVVDLIRQVYDRDIGRVMREGTCSMRIVRTAAAVKRRLYESYSPALARSLYGTWLELSAIGEDAARAKVSRMTFYRHRKALQDAGCSWHGGDVKLDTAVRLVPEDFTPQRHDPRRLVGEHLMVAEALAPYRAAS